MSDAQETFFPNREATTSQMSLVIFTSSHSSYFSHISPHLLSSSFIHQEHRTRSSSESVIMNHDDFNSFDVEFEDASSTSFSNCADNASITEIIDHAFDDGIASKKTFKQLINRKMSGKIEYMNTL